LGCHQSEYFLNLPVDLRVLLLISIELTIAAKVTPNASYFIAGFLKQSSLEEAQKYLGIVPGGTPVVPPVIPPVIPPVVTPDWPQSVAKKVDQAVTNSIVLVDDAELFLPVLANSFYLVELMILYSGNSSQGDYRASVRFPSLSGTGSAVGFFNGFSANMAASITAVEQGAGRWPLGDAIVGVSGTITEYLCCYVRFLLRTGLGGEMRYQFANGKVGTGRIVITRAGSTMRMQKLA